MRVVRSSLESEASESVLSRVASETGSAEQIERAILFDEILARLTPDERMVCIWKKAGFSSKEIADRLGHSVGAVDTLFHRIKTKVQRMLQVGSQKRAVLKAEFRAEADSKEKANG